MKPALAFLFAAMAFAQPPNPDIQYRLGPDSLPQDGVPHGEIRGPFPLPSQAYPGTSHTYWVYVPAQYNAAVPASLMIFNDGQAFMAPQGDARAQNVLDNRYLHCGGRQRDQENLPGECFRRPENSYFKPGGFGPR
jgi:hypothetical protein